MIDDAFIFDLDGTLAIRGDRSPYEFSKVGLDLPKRAVVNMLIDLANLGYKIIIFSGREDSCKKETMDWLKRVEIDHLIDHMDMRETGDKRCDTVVKREMYKKIIGKYNVLGVFDDRNKVVKMWRELRLTCYQVAEGDF